jgi:hypothetical protein
MEWPWPITLAPAYRLLEKISSIVPVSRTSRRCCCQASIKALLIPRNPETRPSQRRHPITTRIHPPFPFPFPHFPPFVFP